MVPGYTGTGQLMSIQDYRKAHDIQLETHETVVAHFSFSRMNEWPIFDSEAGFGGDGVPGTYTLPPDPDNVGATASPSPEMLPPNLVYKGCVQDGPFANLTLHLGPGKLVTTRCLVRGFHSLWWRQLDSAAVGRVLASKSFEEFRVTIDQEKSGLHGGGHPVVGGEMSNLYSASGGELRTVQ